MHDDIETAIQAWAKLNPQRYRYRVTIRTGGLETSALVDVDTREHSVTSSNSQYEPYTVTELFSLIIHAKYQLDDQTPARSVYLFDSSSGVPLLVRQGEIDLAKCPDFSDLTNDDCDYYRLEISDFEVLRNGI